MTPDSLEIDRRFDGVGRLKRRIGSTNPVLKRKYNRMLDALVDEGRTDILRALKEKRLSFAEVYEAHVRGQIHRLPLGETVESLAVAMTRWLGTLRDGVDYSKKHIESLDMSRKYFERAMPRARVAELPDVLEKLRNGLGMEHPRSFNLARAAALAFVRATLKRSHPLWAAVAAVERRKTVPQRRRSPLSVKQMEGFFPNRETNHVDALAWTMATTGMGAQELWGGWSTRRDRVHIIGTKRRGRVRDVPLVLPPVVPTIHRRTFEDALRERVGRQIVAYDLRRTFAYWLELAGIPRTRRRQYLGHGFGDVTELYERHQVDDYLVEDGTALRAVIEDAGVESVGYTVHQRRGGLVYFIRDEASGHVKIGLARDPLARLRELQVGSPSLLTLLGVLPGGPRREREIHGQFASINIRGEWYRGTSELLAWVKDRLAAAPTESHTVVKSLRGGTK